MDIRRANPLEGSVGLAALLIGLLGLIQGAPSSGALASLWPGYGALLYYGALLVSGGALVAGLLMTARRPTRASLGLWKTGLIGIAGLWGTYGVALLIMASGVALTSGLVLLTVAIGALLRWAQVRKAG